MNSHLSSDMVNSVIDLLSPVFEKYGDRTALVFNEEKISYKELEERVWALSTKIRAAAPGEKIIAVSCARSFEAVINVLAILKAGKTYLPVDFDQPNQRIASILAAAGVKTGIESDPTHDFSSVGVLSLHGREDADQQEAVVSDLAFVLFTSGSTGVPKGVCMPHAALINLVQWQAVNSGSGPGFHTLHFAKLTFDVSFQEIFCTLSTGGILHLAEDATLRDPYLLLQLIDRNQVNRIFLPFIALQGLANAASTYGLFPSSLREIMTAGEQLKISDAVKKLFLGLENCTLFNQYGPTESHVVTQLKLTGHPGNWEALPTIGTPISNVGILLLDGEGKSILTEPGQEGEICIYGVCLAEGYLNQPELTKEKFIGFEMEDGSFIKIYKTGDLGTWTSTGEVSYIGRRDDQVKINGFRVELGEVEMQASQLSGIAECAVITELLEDGQKYLALYYVTNGSGVDEKSIKVHLETLLPSYMVPIRYVKLDVFPKTTSGKIDRKLLPALGKTSTVAPEGMDSPRKGTESQLAMLWKSVLPEVQIARTSNFFEIGGSSILAQKLALKIKEAMGSAVSVAKIYQYPVLKTQAENLFKNLNSSYQQEDYQEDKYNSVGKDVAVIAMSGRFPGAEDTAAFWDLIKNEKEGISFFDVEELDPLVRSEAADPNYVRARGILENADKFDYGFFGLNPKLAAIMDPQQRLFLEVSYEALEKAGWIAAKPAFKIGVFAGTNNNTYYSKNIVFDKELADVFGAIQVMSLNEKDYVATRTAYQFDLKGPAVSVYSACSTSLLAVAQAVQSIRSGQCTAALAGGSSVTFPIHSGQRHEDGAIFSSDGHCRPFDADASGTLFSDGAGVVLLKSYERAIADGDSIYAVIKGVGVNNDGAEKSSFSAPSIFGQAEVVQSAMRDAGVEPSQISYVEAHGTATPIGDPIEIEALKLAFGPDVPSQQCAIGSVKSNLGHLTAASGVAGLIKTIYALREKTLPASLGYRKPNPEIDFTNSPFYVSNRTAEWKSEGRRVAGVSSFGIGGTNVHVVVEEHIPAAEPKRNSSGQGHVLAFSAKSEPSLKMYAQKLEKFVRDNREKLDLVMLCETLNRRNPKYNYSQVVAFQEMDQLLDSLVNIGSGQTLPITKLGEFDYPVFLFPGQGSQYLEMGKSLYTSNEVFRKAFDSCVAGFNNYLPIPLEAVIFNEGTLADNQELLSNTRYTQPAIFSVSYALSKLLDSLGIQAAAYCGHSIGEFVGAHLAGVFTLEDTIKVVAHRGRIISELPGGSMLSIKSQADMVLQLLPEGLTIAVVNAPNLCVVSGTDQDIATFKDVLDGYSIASQVLKTSHAFHSPMMDPALAEFAEILASVTRNLPQTPIMSTATGKWLSDAEATSVDYWTAQLRQPVLFSSAVEAILDELPQAYFIEVGPGNVLGSLVMQHKQARNHPVASMLSRIHPAKELSHLLTQLELIKAKGAYLESKGFYHNQGLGFLEVPTYAFDRKTCWNQTGSLYNPAFKGNTEQVQVINKETNDDFLHNKPTVEMTTSVHFTKLQHIIEEVSGFELNQHEIQIPFFELGLDSLVLTQMAFSIKKEFNVQISFRQLNDSHNSPKAVLDHLDQILGGPTVQTTTSMEQVSQHKPVNTTTEDPIALLQRQLEAINKQFQSLQSTGGSNGSATSVKATAPVYPGGQSNPQISDEELKELKKPFGAVARIEKHMTQLSVVAQRFLKSFTQEYNTKTASSKAYSQSHRQYMADPRVVTGFKPAIKELVYPIVTSKSKGSRLTDIDGNTYLDWLNGFGSNMFGYQPDFITQALKGQIDRGFEIGPQHVLAGEVCKLISEMTGSERVGLCNTGSEAVLGAMRIARTVSGKSLIVAFSGSYHGINDEVLVKATKSGKTFPAAPGILADNVQQMLILEYGSEESLRIIAERADEIAAVLVEPVQSRRPEFVPVEFLNELRTLTLSKDVCLIFDEVITGFRADAGGVQKLLGIRADLVTYGKVVGGGLPIGVIGGKASWMDALDGGFWEYGDESVPPSGVTYFAGTFVRHPLTLSAALASLNEMNRRGAALQDGLSDLTSELVGRMNEVFERFNCPYYAVNFKSLWKIKLKEEFPYSELLFTLLRNQGIHIWENFPCFTTAAHRREDVDFTIQKLESVLETLIANEIVQGDLPDIEDTWMDSQNPPFPGAKISLDENGNPKWVQDPISNHNPIGN